MIRATLRNTKMRLLPFYFSLLLPFCLIGIAEIECQNTYGLTSNSKELGNEMHLELTLHSNSLEVKILNTSSKEVRLWELENSWGWYSISLLLREDSDKQTQVIKRTSRDWTKNGPYFFVLSPGEARKIPLNTKDGWWDWNHGVSELKNKLISIRARLEIDPSPEAKKYSVFVGSVLSDWVVSLPPHSWLFSTN
ncbi:hypothetical protein [Microcystis sp. LEGE 08355]|uniref:hypothetical protein n=1 Tax=Microcystis sp. LEGE 08355 TaxID=1828687 RepID=UPI00187E6888|nr:hypothetical protein [Microcystis sp. LEGE 08355]MBE9072208.1 hypothetical protein [Microcystis sp. LEGE 08355]